MTGKIIVAQRVRQVLAVDKNALDLYTDLAARVEDPGLKEMFGAIAADERRHVNFSEKILELLK